ncbi:hypothetical protein CesoFtcFv8_017685 [Champsocephalus esox]|uniref:Uncharacterized protein n=1 Tax=Champsocephalus esox TaxID=159716 RepID=A0AAN8BKD5_9TELE|nr:hypothetical protein CesoFtcFv8_017685 [Champsocephalus esox]
METSPLCCLVVRWRISSGRFMIRRRKPDGCCRRSSLSLHLLFTLYCLDTNTEQRAALSAAVKKQLFSIMF